MLPVPEAYNAGPDHNQARPQAADSFPGEAQARPRPPPTRQEVDEMVGEAFMRKTKGQGKVVKGWVEQERILAHPAIGGFMNHGGWNSVTEAAALGVPMMAWSTNEDQPVNAEVVQLSGLGVYDREWGGGRLIGREEIANKLRATVREVKEKARRAREECLLHALVFTNKCA